jgi:hypothetical protein
MSESKEWTGIEERSNIEKNNKYSRIVAYTNFDPIKARTCKE